MVTISDIEWGRLEINASDLGLLLLIMINRSVFYPPSEVANNDELSTQDEELLFFFFQFPATQKRIAIKYLRQQVDVTNMQLRNKILNI
jgi:hypothetical protein